MGEPAVKVEVFEKDSQKKFDVLALVSLIVFFGLLVSGWAISFPPIYYHLFVK